MLTALTGCANDQNIEGDAIAISNHNNWSYFEDAKVQYKSSSSGLDYIKINGKEVDISRIATKYDDTIFGAGSIERSLDKNIYIFQQGNITSKSDIPNSGSFTYRGKAVYYTPLGGSNTSNVSLSVDFGSKAISGSLSGVSLNAKIDGNKFNGNNVKGQFNGDNAKEMSGIIHSSSIKGAFGAKKQ